MFTEATRRGNVLERLRRKLTYGNVMSTIAVFIALGGTSYALTLPRNSVGSRELRPRSVGSSELKSGAVTSLDIRDRTIRLRDIAPATRGSLRGVPGPPGPQGPAGVTFFAQVDASGHPTPGDVASVPEGLNGRIISFRRSVFGCAYSATLARVPGGSPEEAPPGASVVVASSGNGVLVRTWDAANQPKRLPFHLIVAC
jgi:hypothetical protein